MRIEKLNDNKIRIFLNTEDLKEKNIDIHTLMSNSIESQDLFIDMLNYAETQIGFKTKNYKLFIEALASSEGNFVFTITRVKPDSANVTITKPKIKRQIIVPKKTLSIFRFNSYDDFCSFCNYICTSSTNDYSNKLKNSSLVLLNNTYYLVLHNPKMALKDFKCFSYITSEFAKSMNNENLLESRLKEYGKTVISKDAIKTCYIESNQSKKLPT